MLKGASLLSLVSLLVTKLKARALLSPKVLNRSNFVKKKFGLLIVVDAIVFKYYRLSYDVVI